MFPDEAPLTIIDAKFVELEFKVTVPELLVKSPSKERAASAFIVNSAPELIVISSSKTFPSLLDPSSLLITGWCVTSAIIGDSVFEFGSYP